jgi:hypothetical protein
MVAGRTKEVLTMKKYKVVTNSDVAELERELNQLAEHGWTVVSVSVSVSLNHREYVAAMVKDQ